ncbi:glutamate--tRNA ligase [Candidatus Falkowbacteria bacterium]|uniref:Glutamate--tRNA ligase n=1 Tax=Candidatus Falkowbacteria bacterium CG10_big_fil_rev_8_21_14_0_10_37_18 TaxID=1974562 RepID=A0A2H0VBE1_9BACT|nr:glutamate--tRNA ligase [Candidatus Falkowbacteria bacterium]NCQ12473.1 glutamate--tRNA ligase [Candidatus Falkowbacteria bacterium]OIO06094.1 MAG: glutamate--tRNA ligase [Candidatus Falkowbacteria bacterium CG1_02_37_21]PIR95669.1 MAG: glutamate--tRNA ligase [Candidatus Falkowbacteria bacterium CG10_big_fil_rev_8_21_14_0_10_37_18]
MRIFGYQLGGNKIRFRFAPSPTGLLHIGNLRTALFGYLLAKSLGGKFILRLEDTDQKREVAGAGDSLIKILQWVGIKFDEGYGVGGKYGPYLQTERLNIYDKLSTELLAKGGAYHCFCTEDRLTAMRAEQEKNKQAPRYDRLCRSLSPEEVKKRVARGEKFVIRQAMPLSGEVLVHDELRDDIKFRAEDLDDQVLIKSNGIPTYQFANIVDDHLMEISHVTRGDEWLSSFPKNILLYQAFGWTPPKFIHLPLIMNKGGGKLSKRQGDVYVENYRDQGYLPEAIINFCALLGWHSKDDKEIWTLTELAKSFSVSGMGVSPAIFDLEKLDYYNGYYLRKKPLSELADLCRPYLEVVGRKFNTQAQLLKFVALASDRLKKIGDIVPLTDFLFELPKYEPELLCWKKISLKQTRLNMKELEEELKKIKVNDWTKEYLEKTLLTWIKDHNYKNGEYLGPLRVALTGLKNSPGPFEVAEALGQEESLRRIALSLE